MKKNEIYRAYGTDFVDLTLRLLEKAGLWEAVEQKAAALGTDPTELRIALKPNLVCCTPPETGATTHTQIAEAVLLFLRRHGCRRLRITEGSWVGDRTEDAFEYLGWNALAARLGAEVIDCQKQPSFWADCAGMELSLCECVRETDFLINLPVLKGHCQTRVTCALKNLKGLIPNAEKRRFHTMGLHRPIAHLNARIHQDFIVIDHICGDPSFEEGGDPLVRNCVMAARDPVLTDAYAARLLGYGPEEIPYIPLAAELGVGSMDLSELCVVTVEGTSPEELPEARRVLDAAYAVDALDTCSACYGMLLGALTRLKAEYGSLDPITGPIAIGQGWRGRTGRCGVGTCTRLFDLSVPGCPPTEEAIYTVLRAHWFAPGAVTGDGLL